MHFSIDKELFSRFSGTTIGVVVAYGIDNKKSHPEIQKIIKSEIEKLQKMNAHHDITKHPYIECWKNAYKNFGAKGYQASVERLVARVVKTGELPEINTLVDLYNLISLQYLLPVGGEDLHKITGDIALRFATADEKAVVILGESELKAPKRGEIIYADAQGAICRRWNWKEAERTKLTESTSNAILVLDGIAPVSRVLVEAATHALAGLIQQYCGGDISVAILDENRSQVALQKNGVFVSLDPIKPVDPEIQPITFEQAEEQKAASQEHLIRVEKVEKMRANGIEPWPYVKPINANTAEIIDDFNQEKNQLKEYTVVGRILTIREHGKAIFATMQDSVGKLQFYVKQDVVGKEQFLFFSKSIDVGDIIWLSGTSFKTKMGEITLAVEAFTLMSKCLHPLPEKFHGIADIETKYRQRYLDLITNAESRERFEKRSHIISGIRNFLESEGYMEVETPMLQTIPGGAAARPFITHHNALDMQLFMRIAPELYLKRLVVGGFDRVYEINRNFRNEGISTKHNPEFTMLEFYTANIDFNTAMDITEKMLHHIALHVTKNGIVTYGNYTLNFAAPFVRLPMIDAVAQYAKCAASDLQGPGIDTVAQKHGISFEKNMSWGHKLNQLFEQLVESHLINPTFITQYPIEISPLSKRNPHNLDFADRFELFVAGMELSNGFNELNDPFDQADRFRQQAQQLSGGDVEAHHYDADFIKALEYGLPPTAGVGVGIDRLAMLLTNAPSIRDVILFPTMKPKQQ